MKTEKGEMNIDELLAHISNLPLLDVEEEKAAIKVVQENELYGGEEMIKLVTFNQRHVISVANQYKDKGLSFGELLEVGTEGLKMAIRKFDLGGESKFAHYAVLWIRQHIIQAIARKTEAPGRPDNRIESLTQTLERNHHRWNETFKDEDTGEEVTVERDELISTDTTEKERVLMESVAADAAQISTEDLCTFVNKTRDFWPCPFDEVYFELARRGDESWACVIDNPAMLLELCDKGVKEAAEQLYHKYRYGDEKNGIFIDKRLAKIYYDLAGDAVYEQYSDEDFPGEEDPKAFHYALTGEAATLDGVVTLINDLCQRFGTPDNECGLFVPQQMLMKMLFGSDSEYYRGNILTMERKAPDSLVITTEADKGEPLLYALRQAFHNLSVEMKEGEW